VVGALFFKCTRACSQQLTVDMVHVRFARDNTDSQPFAAARQQRLGTRISQVHLINSVPSQWQHPLQLALALHSQAHTAAVTTNATGAAATTASVVTGDKENNGLQLRQREHSQQQQQQQQKQYVRTQLPCAQQPLSPPAWTALSSSSAAPVASNTAASAGQACVRELLPFDVLQMAKSGGKYDKITLGVICH
jgi:hypothetical protein